MNNEQNTLKKIMKLDLKSTIKILPLLTMIIVSAGLIYILFFLYKNFYQTITHAQKIELLRDQVSIIKIDTELYEKIIKDSEKRKNANFIELSGLKNPFQVSDEKSSELKINP